MTFENQTVHEDLVSIIIPVYNGEETIERALLSCINQKYTKIEIIVVDDGSTDQTASRIKKYLYDERIIYIHQENAERSIARNNGIQHAKGNFIQFLDADDELESDKIIKHVNYLKKNISICGVYGPIRYVKNGQSENFHYTHSNNYSTKLWMTNFIPINALLIRNDPAIKFNEGRRFLEDWEYIIDYYLKNGTIEPISYGKAIVHLHEVNSSNDLEAMKNAHIEMLIHLIDEAKTKNKTASNFQLLRIIGAKDYIKKYGVQRLLKTVLNTQTVNIIMDLFVGKVNGNK